MEKFDILIPFEEEIKSTEIDSLESLEKYRIRFLGSKNCLKPLFGEIRNVAPERKKDYGQAVNALKQLATTRFEEAQESLSSKASAEEHAAIDLTRPSSYMPVGSRHPVSIGMDKIISIFKRIGFTVATDREIEDEWHNFTALNTPEDHPARDMTDTYYIQGEMNHMLRSQTSTVQIRVMENQKPPIRIISPGRVYRNETISARSHCQFHQVEGLYVDKNVSFADMKQTLNYYAKEMYGPDVVTRLRPSYFPFTEPSAEMDVYWGLETEADYKITKGTGWLEIMGCGMVDPNVLRNCNIDPEEYSGFAFGMGIERQLMFHYKINDIRRFYQNDIRFLSQFKATF